MRGADVATRGRAGVAGRRPSVVALTDAAALDPTLVGAKAAALARATSLGLPVLPGVVLATNADVVGAIGRLRSAWERLTDDGRRSLAVRSSSTVEDSTTSSMAGVFDSILDVDGWTAFLDALATVRRSAGEHPMAVLVQPMLDSAIGGVLFGLDPVTGRPGRLVVEVVPGNPSSLVSGLAAGTRYVLGRRGRAVEADDGPDAVPLPRRTRRDLARLASATAAAFGGPQDVEWSVDARGVLWLLQSRPVTATAVHVEGRGPLLGPGPVAETLPHVLSPLESDLWVDPLRAGVAEAVLAALAAARADGLDDVAAVARHPVLLALTAPEVGRRDPLPEVAHAPAAAATTLALREALRLRARWLQELTARAVEELGRRFGVDLRTLRLDELADVVAGGALPADLPVRALPSTPPLPARFRLGPRREVVAEASGPCLGGRGAGGGRAMGRVGDGTGTVLVVRTLEPGLAGVLPGRVALVAETGSTLSHLAILARELGVPTVVGVEGAVERFPSGTTIVVDGTTGEVTKADA